MSQSEIRGYLYILIGATLWGVSSVVAKSFLNTRIPWEERVLRRLALAMHTFLLSLFLF